MKARRWKMRMFLVALLGAGLLAPSYAKIIASSGCHYPARPKDKNCWEYGLVSSFEGYVCFVRAYNPSAPSWVVVREGFDHKRGSSSAGKWASAELGTEFPARCVYGHSLAYSALGMSESMVSRSSFDR